jgi:hypothetical protein
VGRKGGLQIGLNAIVSIIISIIIFGFGLMLITNFADKATIPPPDHCANDISSQLRQNKIFATCVTDKRLTEGEMRKGIEVAYAYQNLDNIEKTLFFHIKDEITQDFRKQESSITIPANSAGRGVSIIGLNDPPTDYASLNAINYIIVVLCESDSPGAYDTTIDGCITQEEIISIRKR